MNISKFWLDSEGNILNCRGKEANAQHCFYNARNNSFVTKSKSELLKEGYTPVSKQRYYSELDLLEVLRDE